MKIIIKDGWIIDPAQELEGRGHVWIEDGIIQKVGINLDFKLFCEGQVSKSDTVIEATDKWVIPGLVDMHVHFRDPGLTHKEDIKSGCLAAAAGGVTTVCCMPNTKPAIDKEEAVAYVLEEAAKANGVHVFPVGAVTLGQEGKELADYAKMLEASKDGKGICAISEDGKTVMDEKLMHKAMVEAAKLGIPVLSHTEDHTLSGGAMHKCDIAKKHKISGIPPEAEENIVRRDIRLAQETGCQLHICHVSTKGSVKLIEDAKKKGIKVTAEVTPHHLTLTARNVIGPDGSPDANKKMAPPLRMLEDKEALRQAVKDGVIDAIATDHAPHQDFEKDEDFEKAPFGSIGLETSFAVCYTELVKTGLLTPMELVDRMSSAPAKILGIEKGALRAGSEADVVVIDPDKQWTVGEAPFLSKSRNSPFMGKRVCGKVLYTVADGNIVFEAGR